MQGRNSYKMQYSMNANNRFGLFACFLNLTCSKFLFLFGETAGLIGIHSSLRFATQMRCLSLTIITNTQLCFLLRQNPVFISGPNSPRPPLLQSYETSVVTAVLVVVLVIRGLKPYSVHRCSHNCCPQLSVLRCSKGTVLLHRFSHSFLGFSGLFVSSVTPNATVFIRLLLYILNTCPTMLGFFSITATPNLLFVVAPQSVTVCHHLDGFARESREIFQFYPTVFLAHVQQRLSNVYIWQKCGENNMSNRLSIPECLLLVMQRVTKYPLLLESIAKTTDGTGICQLNQLRPLLLSHFSCPADI